MNFQRGLEPKDGMGIGTEALIKSWLLKNNPNHEEDFEVKGDKVKIKRGYIILKNFEYAPIPGIEFTPKKRLIVFDEIPIGEKLPTFKRLFQENISDKKNKTLNIGLSEDDLQDYHRFTDLLKQILKESGPIKFPKK